MGNENMLNEIKREVQTNLAPLLGEVLKDAQKLVRQEIALARSEIKQDVSEVKIPTISLSVALIAGLVALVLLSLTIVHLLRWAFPETLPYWACYGIVTLVFAAAGAVFYTAGREKAEQIDAVPGRLMETMRENAEWLRSEI